MKKHLLSMLLVLAIVLSLVPAIVLTTSAEDATSLTYYTINDGTITNAYIPIYCRNNDTAGQHSQIIFQSSKLTAIGGKKIESLTFYYSTNPVPDTSKVDGIYSVKLKSSTAGLSLGSGFISTEGATEVYNGKMTFDNSTGTMVITFSTPFTYVTNSDLLLDVSLTANTKNWKDVYFFGVTEAGMSYHSKDGQRDFSPRVSFGYKNETCYIDANSNGVFDGSEVKYDSVENALMADYSNETQTKPTTIRLIDNVTENVAIPAARYITLDLDGYVLKADLSDEDKHSVIVNEGTLTITDSNRAKAHKFDATAFPWTLTSDTATGEKIKTVKGGIITGGNVGYNSGGGIHNSGKLTMIGGTIVGNQGSASAFTVAYAAGGVYNGTEGVFTMTGGGIIGNLCLSVMAGKPAGGVCNLGSMTVGGTAVICDNARNSGEASDLYIIDGNQKISVSTDTPPVAKNTNDAAKAYMYIGVFGTPDPGESWNFTGEVSKDVSEHFFRDNMETKIVYVIGKDTIPAHIELKNRVSIITDDAVALALESDSMTYDEAIEIINLIETHYMGFENAFVAYAKADDFAVSKKYKAISFGVYTEAANDMTIEELLAAADAPTSKDIYVIGEIAPHIHAWTYAADSTNKDTLLAYCTAEKCDGTAVSTATAEKLKIIAPTLTTYGESGKSEKATLSVQSLGGETVSADSIKYYQKLSGAYGSALSGAPTAAGDYKAEITVKEKTAYVEYTIAKAASSMTKDPTAVQGLIYNASARTLISNDAAASNGSVQYALGKNATTAPTTGWGTTLPQGTNAKTYYVWYKCVGNTNYSDTTPVCVPVTIDKKELTVTAGTYKVSKVYDGTTGAGSGSGTLTVTGIEDSDKTVVSVAPGVAPAYGAKDVKSDYSLALPISISGDDTYHNYKIKDNSAAVAVPGEITAKTVTVTADDKSLTVGGTLPQLTYTASGFVGSETFTTEPEIFCEADGKTAGTYEIVVSGGTVSNNYTLSRVNGTMTVSKKQDQNGAVSAHSITVIPATFGTVTADVKYAITGAAVTLTVKADDGCTMQTVSVKDAYGDTVAVTKQADGTYIFLMPDSNVTVKATFRSPNPFLDVQKDDYFYDTVIWAAKQGITTGTDAAHFSPDGVTTRAQMVTLLWRAAGSIEPTAKVCPFTDVKADAYYYRAVLWAYENGYVKGTSRTTFSPDMTVTRGQCAAILARYCGVKDEAKGYTHGFTDVRARDYYNNAVAWAAENGITTGITETTFAPGKGCTRAQIVTFLYRCMNK